MDTDISKQIAETPVFVLCGGLGTRIKEETEFRPKPMVPIGNQPILWHIMRYYSSFGFRKFVLCLGFRADVIRNYFLHYHEMNSDFSVDLKHNNLEIHSVHHDEDWKVTLAYTGELTMTGGRLSRAASKYLGNAQHAAVTYGDGLCNAALRQEFDFHLQQEKIGTVLGVNPPSRFGELKVEGHDVIRFDEKPEFKEKWINGGYFFFRRDFFEKYLIEDENCVLEQAPLRQLTEDGELNIYRHDGFWACMDTQRDRDKLNEIYASGNAPWVVESQKANTQLTSAS